MWLGRGVAGRRPEALVGLVEKSLVLAETADGLRRFRFLETIREYAADQLVRLRTTKGPMLDMRPTSAGSPKRERSRGWGSVIQATWPESVGNTPTCGARCIGCWDKGRPKRALACVRH